MDLEFSVYIQKETTLEYKGGRKIQRRKNSKISTKRGMSTHIIGTRVISKEMEKEHMHSPSSAFKQHQYSINWQQTTNNVREINHGICTETSNRWLSLSNFN